MAPKRDCRRVSGFNSTPARVRGPICDELPPAGRGGGPPSGGDSVAVDSELLPYNHKQRTGLPFALSLPFCAVASIRVGSPLFLLSPLGVSAVCSPLSCSLSSGRVKSKTSQSSPPLRLLSVFITLAGRVYNLRETVSCGDSATGWDGALGFVSCTSMSSSLALSSSPSLSQSWTCRPPAAASCKRFATPGWLDGYVSVCYTKVAVRT